MPYRVLGIGGAAVRVLERLIEDGSQPQYLIAANTDAQSLHGSQAGVKLQLGKRITRGLGAGGDPELGAAAAEEVREEFRQTIQGASLVFVCVGLGGGTGSGAAPMFAQVAREMGAFVVVFATMPFQFEGRRRTQQALDALHELRKSAHAVICFENDRMGAHLSQQAGIHEAFANADQTVAEAILAIAGMANRESLIQLGFDEILSVLSSKEGRTLFGFGQSAQPNNRAKEALSSALENPLMDGGQNLSDVENLIVQVTGGPSMTLLEVQEMMEEIGTMVGPDTHILFGLGVERALEDTLTVMLFSASGKWSSSNTPLEKSSTSRPLPPDIQRGPVETSRALEPEPRRQDSYEDQESSGAPRGSALLRVAQQVRSQGAGFMRAQAKKTLDHSTPSFAAQDETMSHGSELRRPVSVEQPSHASEAEEDLEELHEEGISEQFDSQEIAGPLVDEDPILSSPQARQASAIETPPPPVRTRPPVSRPERNFTVPPKTAPSDFPRVSPSFSGDGFVPTTPPARVVQPVQKDGKPKPQQEMLQFDQSARGRFEKIAPTIVNGEDLDIPTFMRKKKKTESA
ncbi:MAG: cell division protein FtsZ [Verrucomicrobiales bacterium]